MMVLSCADAHSRSCMHGCVAVIIALIAIFAVTALFVKRKRMLKQAQKPPPPKQ